MDGPRTRQMSDRRPQADSLGAQHWQSCDPRVDNPRRTIVHSGAFSGTGLEDINFWRMGRIQRDQDMLERGIRRHQ